MNKTDIILVGYGPTSAVLASLLAPLGWNIEIFDQNVAIYDLPRAVFFDDEVMRIFQQIGLSQEMLECTIKVQGMDLVNDAGENLATYRAPKTIGNLGWHAGYMFHQPTLESLLRSEVQRYPNVKVHLGHKVTKVASSDGLPYVDIEGPDGDQQYSAKFLVGCCGAKSITRAALKTEIHDFGADQAWLVIDIELLRDPGLPSTTVQYCTPARPSTYIPTPGLFRRFELMLMPNETEEDISQPNKISKLLSQWIAPEDYRVIRSAVYQFHALVAQQWRSGPILIAGDAAHQMPPFLGQGMCSGIKDAANLYWKLDLVLRGLASASLLDTYQEERKAFVTEVIKSDLWLSKMIQTTDPETAKQRDLHLLSTTPTERQLQPPQVKLGGKQFDLHPACGLPFPQPINENGQMNDSNLGNRFTLVGNVTHTAYAQKTIDNHLIKVINEPSTAIQKWLDEHCGTKAALVRPDRYVHALIDDADSLDIALQSLALIKPIS